MIREKMTRIDTLIYFIIYKFTFNDLDDFFNQDLTNFATNPLSIWGTFESD